MATSAKVIVIARVIALPFLLKFIRPAAKAIALRLNRLADYIAGLEEEEVNNPIFSVGIFASVLTIALGIIKSYRTRPAVRRS